MIPDHIVDLAEELSCKSDMKQKISAIIFNGDDILGRGYNRKFGSITCVHGVPVRSIHAEISAIRWTYRKYGTRAFNGSTIYVHRHGNRLARPCSVCMSVIEMFELEVLWSPL